MLWLKGWEAMGRGPGKEVGLAAHRQKPSGEAQAKRRRAFQAFMTPTCFLRVPRKNFHCSFIRMMARWAKGWAQAVLTLPVSFERKY